RGSRPVGLLLERRTRLSSIAIAGQRADRAQLREGLLRFRQPALENRDLREASLPAEPKGLRRALIRDQLPDLAQGQAELLGFDDDGQPLDLLGSVDPTVATPLRLEQSPALIKSQRAQRHAEPLRQFADRVDGLACDRARDIVGAPVVCRHQLCCGRNIHFHIPNWSALRGARPVIASGEAARTTGPNPSSQGQRIDGTREGLISPTARCVLLRRSVKPVLRLQAKYLIMRAVRRSTTRHGRKVTWHPHPRAAWAAGDPSPRRAPPA